MVKDDERLDLIISYLESIMQDIEIIKSRLNKLEVKKEVKLKYSILQHWKDNIRHNCKYLEVIGIEEEAEFFCSKIKDVCNLFNCPLNKIDNDLDNISDNKK